MVWRAFAGAWVPCGPMRPPHALAQALGCRLLMLPETPCAWGGLHQKTGQHAMFGVGFVLSRARDGPESGIEPRLLR